MEIIKATPNFVAPKYNEERQQWEGCIGKTREQAENDQEHLDERLIQNLGIQAFAEEVTAEMEERGDQAYQQFLEVISTQPTTGELLRKRREEVHVSQRAIAEQAGSIASNISRYETGKTNYIPQKVIEAYAAITETPVQKLYGRDFGKITRTQERYTTVSKRNY